MSQYQTNIRVYYEDTDSAGHVYHANYLKFAERARVEHFRQSGWQPSDADAVFAVVAMNIQFKASAELDDELTVSSTITRLGNTSMDVEQQIVRDGQLLCELKVTLVCIDGLHKPVSLPQGIRSLG